MLVKKQLKYFDVPLEHACKVPVLQELVNTRTNKLYVEGFDNYVITEMINMLCIYFSFLLENCIFKNLFKQT